MIKKTETEIMKNWKTQENPLVSILCIAYNHEDYIEEALNSFLVQETNFPFEIIIHDDASTDNTTNIIKNYAKKYPHIIKTILQKENQTSQGKVILYFLIEKAKGKYHALCETDDYWIDAGKLQTQIDLMKENPECYMSFHAAEKRFNKKQYGKIIAKHGNGNKIFSPSEVILSGGGFCPTASIVMREEAWSTLPDFFNDAPVKDYFLQIFGSLNGGILYIDKVMSVYRQGILGSWSTSMNEIKKRENFTRDMIDTLDKLDIYFDYKYQNEINHEKSKQHYKLAVFYLYNNMFKEFKKYIELSQKTYPLKSFNYLIDYYLRYFPRLIKSLKMIKFKI